MAKDPPLIDGSVEAEALYRRQREEMLAKRKGLDGIKLKSFFYSTLTETSVESLIEQHDELVLDFFQKREHPTVSIAEAPSGPEGIAFYRDLIRWRLELEEGQKMRGLTLQVTILTWVVTIATVINVALVVYVTLQG